MTGIEDSLFSRGKGKLNEEELNQNSGLEANPGVLQSDISLYSLVRDSEKILVFR